MEYVEVVELVEPLDDLDEDLPDLGLLESLAFLLLFCDPVSQVAVIGKLHDDAE